MKQTGLLKEYESFFYKCLTPNLTERLLPVEAFIMLCVKLTHEIEDIDPHYRIVSTVTDDQLVDFPNNLSLAEITITSAPDDLPREFGITSDDLNLTFISDPKWNPLQTSKPLSLSPLSLTPLKPSQSLQPLKPLLQPLMPLQPLKKEGGRKTRKSKYRKCKTKRKTYRKKTL
jgi:hypothetical protein